MARNVVYGLKACDTCRRARAWLESAGIVADWHDVREEGLPPEITSRLAEIVGWEGLINRRSRTWRTLDDDERARAEDDPGACVAEHPTLMKRPVLEAGGAVLVGFDADAWAAALGIGQ